jgi:hypothetical protein
MSVIGGTTLFAPIALVRTAFIAIETAFTRQGPQSTAMGPYYLRLPGIKAERPVLNL